MAGLVEAFPIALHAAFAHVETVGRLLGAGTFLPGADDSFPKILAVRFHKNPNHDLSPNYYD
jgi:hypothetical protein